MSLVTPFKVQLNLGLEMYPVIQLSKNQLVLLEYPLPPTLILGATLTASSQTQQTGLQACSQHFLSEPYAHPQLQCALFLLELEPPSSALQPSWEPS